MGAETNSDNSVPETLALELEILRSLCGARDSTIDRDALLHSLANHVWQDPEHRVVYEALRRMRGRAPGAIRGELPATATRMGFPDVDWTCYLRGSAVPGDAKIEALIDALTAASGSRHQ